MEKVKAMWELVRDNKNLVIPWYLMTSYLYYELDSPIIPDADYDELCKFIKKHWNEIDHFHKHLVNPEYLTAGTGFALQYNERIKNGAIWLLNNDVVIPVKNKLETEELEFE